MNAVEIEQAVSDLVEAPFDRESFAFSFLETFGNKATTIKKLKIERSKKGASNKSDLEGGVLQTKNIHLLVCDEGKVTESLKALVDSPETAKRKVKYALATDGKTIEAENIVEGETLVCDFEKLADHFGFFLALAGITTVKEIRNNAFDIKATSRLNRLYVELLQHNPEWDTAERREEMNHFFARLIFCFFAEDTGIFRGDNLFTCTVEQMSDGTNAHEIVTEIFRSMNIKGTDRNKEKVRPYADQFPYVNGGLFSGSPNAPKFTKIARSYLIHVGHLDWTQINPDIFGSMIQAVADDEERGALGMHYTSVPNILKVLNPLFLDDLRSKLEEAGDNKRKLLNLRNRMARIRVFDPACGSGNFLVIAYKEMREIEAEINKLRGEENRRSDIPLTNFRGIELRHFSAEIARLALIIAEYQCDVLYRGQKLALLEFLPLDAKNWITRGNALLLDWLKICPPTGTGVKITSDDLFSTPLDQTEMDFENEGGETYICGNPPFAGLTKQTSVQKKELKDLTDGTRYRASTIDYVLGWYILAARYLTATDAACAFVSTNSVCQGQSVPKFWQPFLDSNVSIRFAHTSFLWKNLASKNAGVIVVIVGFDTKTNGKRQIFDESGVLECAHVNPYLTSATVDIVNENSTPIHTLPPIIRGSIPNCGSNLTLTSAEHRQLVLESPEAARYIRRYVGSQEISKGIVRYVLLIQDDDLEIASRIPGIANRIRKVAQCRLDSDKKSTREVLSKSPHRFELTSSTGSYNSVAVARTTSVSREYLATDLLPAGSIANDNAFFCESQQKLLFSILVSRLHLVWISTICGRMKNDYRYANTLGWNTFPVPILTDLNVNELQECTKRVLIARESHFPATIADLYDPEQMPTNLREAHERNDETLERIYIGRRFKNDTERLEKLFEMYTKMTSKDSK